MAMNTHRMKEDGNKAYITDKKVIQEPQCTKWTRTNAIKQLATNVLNKKDEVLPLPHLVLNTVCKYEYLESTTTGDLLKPLNSKRTKFTASKSSTKWQPMSLETSSASTSLVMLSNSLTHWLVVFPAKGICSTQSHSWEFNAAETSLLSFRSEQASISWLREINASSSAAMYSKA